MAAWFCEVGGWHDDRVGDETVGVEAVAVIEEPARGFRRAVPGRRARFDGDLGTVRRLVAVDKFHGEVAGMEHLDRSDDDALERVATAGADPCFA